MSRADWSMLALCGVWTAAVVMVAADLKLDPVSAPAWVQAIGSVIAIAAAVAIASDQARTNRNIALEVQHREISGRIEVATYVANEVREFANLMQRGMVSGDVIVAEEDFRRLAEAMDRVPLSELRSGSLALHLLAIRRNFEFLFKLQQQYRYGEAAGQPVPDAIKRKFAKGAMLLNREHILAEHAAHTVLWDLEGLHTLKPRYRRLPEISVEQWVEYKLRGLDEIHPMTEAEKARWRQAMLRPDTLD